MVEKVDADLKHFEIVLESTARARAVHYEPQTDEEKALDKRINLKLDLIIVSLLSLMFIVRLRRKETSSPHYSRILADAGLVLRHRQNKHWFRCDELLHQRCESHPRRHPQFAVSGTKIRLHHHPLPSSPAEHSSLSCLFQFTQVVVFQD